MPRWKMGPQGAYYDPNDSGPDQVAPPIGQQPGMPGVSSPMAPGAPTNAAPGMGNPGNLGTLAGIPPGSTVSNSIDPATGRQMTSWQGPTTWTSGGQAFYNLPYQNPGQNLGGNYNGGFASRGGGYADGRGGALSAKGNLYQSPIGQQPPMYGNLRDLGMGLKR